jgi:hypothetical protein
MFGDPDGPEPPFPLFDSDFLSQPSGSKASDSTAISRGRDDMGDVLP